MEFTISCPIDGPVDVGLEDVETVVLRESERADITFICPHCGSAISVTAIVPAFLLSAIEAMAESAGDEVHSGFVVVGSAQSSEADEDPPEADGPHADAYCEYFRRQLAGVESVDDAINEIDSKRSSV